MKFNGESYVLCICEGAFEQAVIEILLEHNLLKFAKTDLIEERITRQRSA